MHRPIYRYNPSLWAKAQQGSRKKKKSTRRDVYFHLHTKLLTSYRSMYEVGTYNGEPAAACGARCAAAVRRARRRWRRRAARWRQPRSHFLNDRETNPGLAGVPTVTCYNIDRLRASAQTMPGHLIIFLRQKNPTRHKKALTLYTLSF